MTRRVLGSMLLTTLAAACTAPPPSTPGSTTPAETAPAPAAAADTAYTPVVSLNEIMVYVVDPHSNELWDAATRPPQTDAAWRTLNHAAVSLAASGGLTKVSGNGPNDQRWVSQPDWVRHSQSLSDAGLAAVAAVRDRDAAALSKAGDALVLSCINCHREYKLAVPQIWTERQFPPEEQRR